MVASPRCSARLIRPGAATGSRSRLRAAASSGTSALPRPAWSFPLGGSFGAAIGNSSGRFAFQIRYLRIQMDPSPLLRAVPPATRRQFWPRQTQELPARLTAPAASTFPLSIDRN